MPKTPKMPQNIKEVLLKIMQVTESSVEGAQYGLAQFKKLVDKTKMQETLKGMVVAFENCVEDVISKFSSPDGRWNGKVKEEPSQAILAGRAQKAADALKGLNVTTVDLVFAVNDQSQFVRGYTSKEGALDPERLANMDKSFNSFLSSHNVKSEGSVFYKTENDQVAKDAKGNPIRMNPEVMISLINPGYRDYMNKKGIEVNCIQQPYPASAAAPAKEAPSEEAAESGIKTR